MKILALIGCVLSLFLITVVGSKVLAPRPCISSTVVKKLVIEGESHVIHCKLQPILSSGSISFNSPSYSLFKRINRMPQLDYFFPTNIKKLSVFVVKSEPFALYLDGASLILGYEVAKSPGGLERAIVQSIMTLQNPELVKNIFYLEYLTDIYMILATGKNIISLPSSGESRDYALFSWYEAVEDECSSAYRPLWSTYKCGKKALSKESFRPFLSSAVGQTLRGLPLSDLNLVTKNFEKLISQPIELSKKTPISFNNMNQLVNNLIQNTFKQLTTHSLYKNHKWVDLRRFAIASCTPLQPRQILRQYSAFKKLLVVKSCQPLSYRLKRAYIKYGIQSLSSFSHIKQFVEFHLPSLRLVMDQYPAKVFNFQKWIKEQEFKWDARVFAYEPRTAIDAITYLRASELDKK